jgi:hypothetical protein
VAGVGAADIIGEGGEQLLGRDDPERCLALLLPLGIALGDDSGE